MKTSTVRALSFIVAFALTSALRINPSIRITNNAHASKSALYVVTDPGIAASSGTIKLVTVNPTDHDIYTGRDPARIKIFDTTLRDGEQSPGCTMNTEEKLAVAKQLAKLGVDIIEAGFPIASLGDFDAVSKIAQSVGQYDDPPIICGLARALKKDITTCWEAIKFAKLGSANSSFGASL